MTEAHGRNLSIGEVDLLTITYNVFHHYFFVFHALPSIAFVNKICRFHVSFPLCVILKSPEILCPKPQDVYIFSILFLCRSMPCPTCYPDSGWNTFESVQLDRIVEFNAWQYMNSVAVTTHKHNDFIYFQEIYRIKKTSAQAFKSHSFHTNLTYNFLFSTNVRLCVCAVRLCLLNLSIGLPLSCAY